MLSTPVILSVALLGVLGVGYMSHANYKLRKESVDVAELAKIQDESLEFSQGQCKKDVGDAEAKAKAANDKIKQLNDDLNNLRSQSEDTRKKTEAEWNAKNDELNALQGDLEEKYSEIDDLEMKLGELTGTDENRDENGATTEDDTAEYADNADLNTEDYTDVTDQDKQ